MPTSTKASKNLSTKKVEEGQMTASFRGEMAWASNMYPCSITLKTLFGPITAPCSEVFYASAKVFPANQELARSILSLPNGYAAKKAAAGYHLPPEVAIMAMKYIVNEKFVQNKEIMDKLIACPNELLVERNYWHDNFWGDCSCNKCKTTVGQNMLGKILVQVKTLHG